MRDIRHEFMELDCALGEARALVNTIAMEYEQCSFIGRTLMVYCQQIEQIHSMILALEVDYRRDDECLRPES